MTKQQQYDLAMETYHRKAIYNKLGLVVAPIVVSLQIISMASVPWAVEMISLPYLVCFMAAYLVTDFINGFVHMWMDNNEDYVSAIGPLVAIFHLHHKAPRYTSRHPAAIYFFESGSKNWLVVYLGLLVWAQLVMGIPPMLSFFLTCIGVASSLAEMSHYWCHNSDSRTVRVLQRVGLLLSPAHHEIHHTHDNKNYAFLNGISDPLLNLIAKHGFAGYVSRADLQSAAYRGQMNASRGQQ